MLEIIAIIVVVFSIISSIISAVGKQQKKSTPPVSTKYKVPRAKTSKGQTEGVQITGGQILKPRLPKAKVIETPAPGTRTMGPQIPMVHPPKPYNGSYSVGGCGDSPIGIPGTPPHQEPEGQRIKFNRNTLITGIIFSEILSPPRGRRPYKRIR